MYLIIPKTTVFIIVVQAVIALLCDLHSSLHKSFSLVDIDNTNLSRALQSRYQHRNHLLSQIAGDFLQFVNSLKRQRSFYRISICYIVTTSNRGPPKLQKLFLLLLLLLPFLSLLVIFYVVVVTRLVHFHILYGAFK